MEEIFERIVLDSGAQLGVASQIRGQILLLIADGDICEGDRLPAVRSFAQHLGVNLNTVRAAYRLLEDDGVVRTRHGVGTEVLAVDTAAFAGGAAGVRTHTVGVVIGGLDPFYLELLRGLEEAASLNGVLPLIVSAQDSAETAEAAIGRLAARGVDGVIAVSVGGRAGELGGSDAVPIVHVDQPDSTGISLLFDGEGGGAAVTRHLLEHGHERVGYVSPPVSWPNLAEVYSGYVRALAERGLSSEDHYLCEVAGFRVEEGRRGTAQLMELDEPPTAIVASGAMVALGVLQEARHRGLSVPDDLAIGGYGEAWEVTGFTSPSLTMVSLPAYEIGRRAIEAIQQVLARREPDTRRLVLDVELKVRESCGHHS